MRILYVLNDTLHHAGTESVILNYYNHIDRERYQIDFLLNAPKSELEENDICRYLIKKGSKVFCITPRRVDSKKNKQEYLEILKSEKYDIVHTHVDAIGSYFLSLAQTAGVKVRIAHSHNTRHQLANKGIKNRIHYAYLEKCRKDIRREATHYMACSKEAGEWLFGRENIDNKKVYILNNAIDTEKFKFNQAIRDEVRKDLGIKDDELLIGHIGRFKPQKNHSFLIDVFKEISESDNTSKLLLVGDGPLKEEIEEKVKAYNIAARVIFYGETKDPSRLLNAMDIFLFPSVHEGLSVVMVEAQCNGLKCIMSDTDEVSKDTVITDNVECLTLDDPKEWANKTLNAETSRKDETKTLADKGYDITQEAKKLEDFYSGILSE